MKDLVFDIANIMHRNGFIVTTVLHTTRAIFASYDMKNDPKKMLEGISYIQSIEIEN